MSGKHPLGMFWLYYDIGTGKASNQIRITSLLYPVTYEYRSVSDLSALFQD